jgi:hypothetical protein
MDRGVEADERFRLSGRHVRLVLARRGRPTHGAPPPAGDPS